MNDRALPWLQRWWISGLAALIFIGLPSCQQEQSLAEHTYALFDARNDPRQSLDQLVPNLQRLVSEDGSPQAHGLLALCHFYGIGTTPDRIQAEAHADLGQSDPNAAFMRAKLAHFPENPDTPVDQREVIRLYREAVALGSPDAPNNLAKYLSRVEGTSEQEIRALYELGVKRLDLMALSNLSEQLLEEGDRKKGLALLPRAFRDETYRTVSPQLEADVRWRAASRFVRIYLDASEELDDNEIAPDVHAALAHMNSYLREVALKTRTWDLEPEEQHEVAGAYLLALAKIPIEAEEYGKRHSKDLIALWADFEEQHYVLLDPNQSRHLLEAIDELDDEGMRAQVALSTKIVHHIQVRALSTKIVQRMEEAATRQENPDLMFDIGAIYYSGYGVAESDKDAFPWFLKAAEAGHPVSMWNVYANYRSGGVAHQDDAAALHWLRRAADGNYFQAKRELGLFLMDGGLGIETDPAAGAALLQEVARSNIQSDLPWKAALELAERIPTAFPDRAREDVIALYQEAHALEMEEIARRRQDGEKSEAIVQDAPAAGEVAHSLVTYLVGQDPATAESAAEILGIEIKEDPRQLLAESKAHIEDAEYGAARALLQRAALLNEPESFFHLAVLYARGGSMFGDQDLARRYLLAAAKRGVLEAESFLTRYEIYLRLVKIGELFPELFAAKYEAELRERDFYEWLQNYAFLTDDLGFRSVRPLLVQIRLPRSESREQTLLQEAARELEKEGRLLASDVIGDVLLLGFEDGRAVEIRPHRDAIEAVLKLPGTSEDRPLTRKIEQIVKIPESETTVTLLNGDSELVVEFKARLSAGLDADTKEVRARLLASSHRVLESDRTEESGAP